MDPLFWGLFSTLVFFRGSSSKCHSVQEDPCITWLILGKLWALNSGKRLIYCSLPTVYSLSGFTWFSGDMNILLLRIRFKDSPLHIWESPYSFAFSLNSPPQMPSSSYSSNINPCLLSSAGLWHCLNFSLCIILRNIISDQRCYIGIFFTYFLSFFHC